MSSLFSDPPFTRGTTLLNGETIEYSSGDSYANGVPAAGSEIVGQVKAFQDIHPVAKTRLSNELVYCVAARFKPAAESTVLNANRDGADSGQAYVLKAASGMTGTVEFADKATSADVVTGKRVAFLDEYLTGTVRANDIVWLIFKGPANLKKIVGGPVAPGAAIRLSPSGGGGDPGKVVTATDLIPVATSGSESVVIGQSFGTISPTTYDQTLGGTAGINDVSVRVFTNGTNWA